MRNHDCDFHLLESYQLRVPNTLSTVEKAHRLSMDARAMTKRLRDGLRVILQHRQDGLPEQFASERLDLDHLRILSDDGTKAIQWRNTGLGSSGGCFLEDVPAISPTTARALQDVIDATVTAIGVETGGDAPVVASVSLSTPPTTYGIATVDLEAHTLRFITSLSDDDDPEEVLMRADTARDASASAACLNRHAMPFVVVPLPPPEDRDAAIALITARTLEDLDAAFLEDQHATWFPLMRTVIAAVLFPHAIANAATLTRTPIRFLGPPASLDDVRPFITDAQLDALARLTRLASAHCVTILELWDPDNSLRVRYRRVDDSGVTDVAARISASGEDTVICSMPPSFIPLTHSLLHFHATLEPPILVVADDTPPAHDASPRLRLRYLGTVALLARVSQMLHYLPADAREEFHDCIDRCLADACDDGTLTYGPAGPGFWIEPTCLVPPPPEG